MITLKQFIAEADHKVRGYPGDASERAMVNRIIQLCLDSAGSDKNYKTAYSFLESEFGGELWNTYYELFHEKSPSFEGPPNKPKFVQFKKQAVNLFKQYKKSINEDIFVKNGELFAAVNNDTKPKASTSAVISTNRKALGRVSGTTRETPVYYAFSYVPSDTSTEMLKALKGSGNFKFPASRRDKFLDDATSHMAAQFQKIHVQPDVIISPGSSSPLLLDFAEALAKKLDVQFGFFNAFKKTEAVDLPTDKAEALKYIERMFIDFDYLEKKFTGDKDKAVRDIALNIYYNIRKNGGHLAAKQIFKQYGKFVKGFMQHALQGDDEYSLLDKSVMVIDDVLSSGTTMSEMFRIIKDELGAAEVYGAALFSRTSQVK